MTSMLRPINADDNMREGIVYGNMVSQPACGFAMPGSDQRFLLVPVPSAEGMDSFYMCGGTAYIE